MDNAQDVERLFSWLKAPMVHYREFAPQIEVAEAVAAWPIVHKAAVESGIVTAEAVPHGSAAARQRLARERQTKPEAAAQAIREVPLVGEMPAPTPGRLADQPADRLVPPPVQHVPAEPEPPAVAAPAPRQAARQETAPARAAGTPPPPPVDSAAATRYAAGPRSTLFGGEYRGREREPRPTSPVADRHSRSLGAVFSRLSGARDRLPDPRARARTSAGLGGVFDRLR